jgi:UDP-N-acetylmuramate-alanine ligase
MLADVTIVPEIYFVRDVESRRSTPSPGGSISRQSCRAVFLNDFAAICQVLQEQVQSGDVVVTMGIGTVWKVSMNIFSGFEKSLSRTVR